MSEQKMASLMIRGVIAELPEDKQSLVHEAIRQLQEFLEHEDEDIRGSRLLALTLIASEACE